MPTLIFLSLKLKFETENHLFLSFKANPELRTKVHILPLAGPAQLLDVPRE